MNEELFLKDIKALSAAGRMILTPDKLGHHHMRYRVTLTGRENADSLGAVTVRIGEGAFTLQDYLTPDDADLFAGMLRAAARSARLREAERAPDAGAAA